MGKVVDFHSHILPCIDDGSSSVEESVQMLSEEFRQGIECVVATPHFYPHRHKPEVFLSNRENAKNQLIESINGKNGFPQLEMGAEVYFFRGISDSEVISDLTICEKKYILIEMCLPPWSDSMYRELENIYYKRGITPIIAHIDRYISPFRTYKIPEKLEKLPVLVQANASFFLRKTTRKMALRLLNEEKIHLLGSDCHNMETRVPNLGDAVKIIEHNLGDYAIERINYFEKTVLQ